MLTMAERLRVDAATVGATELLHRQSIDELIGDVRAGAARMLLLSVATWYPDHAAATANRLASLLRAFPSVTAVALVTDLAGWTPESVLALGRSGIRTLVDARDARGWRTLRAALDDLVSSASAIEDLAIKQLSDDLQDAPDDCRRFFASLFTAPQWVASLPQLARLLDIHQKTLTRRFERASLPPVKRYFTAARLARVAGALENPAVTVARVAALTEFSSRQALARYIRCGCHLPPSVFRRQFNGGVLLERFRRELVLPYLPVLRTFRPLTGGGKAAAST
jgi:AraC-like DNA-binding protein